MNINELLNGGPNGRCILYLFRSTAGPREPAGLCSALREAGGPCDRNRRTQWGSDEREAGPHTGGSDVIIEGQEKARRVSEGGKCDAIRAVPVWFWAYYKIQF